MIKFRTNPSWDNWLTQLRSSIYISERSRRQLLIVVSPPRRITEPERHRNNLLPGPLLQKNPKSSPLEITATKYSIRCTILISGICFTKWPPWHSIGLSSSHRAILQRNLLWGLSKMRFGCFSNISFAPIPGCSIYYNKPAPQAVIKNRCKIVLDSIAL